MENYLKFEEKVSREMEAVYLTPDVVATRCQVLRHLALRPNERVLDIGSGMGLTARDVAIAVGPGGRVCGVDNSRSMLAISRARCADLPWVEFKESDACTLPYADNEFDGAVSTQVYNYVSDIPAALSELCRILRPSGRAVIMETDYDSLVWNTENQDRMDKIIAAWLKHSPHYQIPRKLTPQLRTAGLAIRHREVIPLFNPAYHANTFSYQMSQIIASYVSRCQGIAKEETDAWLEEFIELEKRNSYFFSLNRYVFVVEKPKHPKGM